MLIKIITGCYGHYENGKLKPKDRNSGAFEVEDAEAKRLVEMGVAEYVNNAVATPCEVCAEEEPCENPPTVAEPENGAEEAVYQYDNSTPMAELRKIAAERGIKVPVGMKKTELLELLSGSDDEDAPNLGAEEPIE